MADNNTYEPENDTNLDASLAQNDVYTPENDTDLFQELVSTPTLVTTTAQAAGQGATLNLANGTATIETFTADASGSGEPDIFLKTGLFTVRKATASATGETISISGQSTLETTGADASATGDTINIVDTGFGTVSANASASGETGLNLVIPPIGTTEASANATGGETSFNVIGTGGEISVLIEGQRIDTYTNIEVEKRLNEVDTFGFEAFITDANDRSLINEGNEVKIIENYNDLLFKGRLTEVEYKSNFRAKCEGNGMVDKLLNRKTDRETFTNSAGNDIVTSVVDSSVITYGDIESAPQVSVRFDHDNLARAVAGVANATAFDWYIDQKEADDYDIDYLNFVERAGRSNVQEVFEIGNDAQMVERNKDEGFVANDITLLGRGDGINQLEARVFAASNSYTDTSNIISETETGSFTVDDTSQLGTTGDNLKVRVGTEVMDVDITDGTTLSINSRALNDYEGNETGQIRHYENIRVWLVENVTQSLGPFTPNSPEAGSSIDANNIKEKRETDKTIVDLSTLEKAADIDLKNRFEDVFRVKVAPVEPRVTEDLRLGDAVDVKDLTAMDVDDTFKIVGMDIRRNSSEEGTVLHLANRPRRLTERLSEIESDKDTLNAHMQGATNINGEHFEDNCDNTHPLNNKVYVPDDVVEINKFNVVFARESFRGYVQNTDHSHSVTVSHPSHSHSVTIPDHDHVIDLPDHTHEFTFPFHDHQITDIPEHTHTVFDAFSGTTTDKAINRSYSPYESDGSLNSSTVYFAGDSDDDLYTSDQINLTESSVDTGSTGGFSDTSEGGGGIFTTTGDGGGTTETSSAELGNSTSETTDNSGAPQYGIFEPVSEPNIDIEVRVDGNLVTTVSNVSVGQEQTTPIDLKPFLGDPLTGAYHDVELKPVDTGGGENGRCKLAADINQKVFIESTL